MSIGLILAVSMLTLWGNPSLANVRFQIITPAQESELFLVNVRITHYTLHSTTGKTVAFRMLTSNQSHLIRINFTNPILYNNVYINYYHPEYVHAV